MLLHEFVIMCRVGPDYCGVIRGAVWLDDGQSLTRLLALRLVLVTVTGPQDTTPKPRRALHPRRRPRLPADTTSRRPAAVPMTARLDARLAAAQ